MAATKKNEPKEERLEVRLSKTVSDMLSNCCSVFGVSKAEVVRMGIEQIHNYAEIEIIRFGGEDDIDYDELINNAKKRREEMEYQKVYKPLFDREYARHYARLILNPNCTALDAEVGAYEIAHEAAELKAMEAVNYFWNADK